MRQGGPEAHRAILAQAFGAAGGVPTSAPPDGRVVLRSPEAAGLLVAAPVQGDMWETMLYLFGRIRACRPERVPDGNASMGSVTFDVEAVRAAYPALRDGYAYLDGAAGAAGGGHRHRGGRGPGWIGNAGGAFPASHRAGAITTGCRQAVADLVGGVPDGVILGPNMTTLTYRLAGALAATWRPGDEVVVSRLDHDANVRPSI